MERKWLARLSMMLSITMVAGLAGVWRASGARSAPAVVTVGVDLASASVEQATYELIVTNRGDSNASAVRVTDTVPRGTRFLSASPAPASDSDCRNGGPTEPAGSVCRWNVPSLAQGEEKRIVVTFSVVSARPDRPIRNQAMAAHAADLSRHTNDRFVLTTHPLANDTGCSAGPLSPRQVTQLVRPRSLTGGRALDQIFDARMVCGPEGSSPLLVAAAAAAAAPTCIDVDPEAASGPANSEIALTALVTDGTATNRTGAESANDSCSGVAQNNVNVIFAIEDDDPDAYISRVETFPTQGQPNTQTGTTDTTGRTDIGVRLVAPAASAEGNRVSGRIDGTSDVPETGSSPLCGVPPPAGPGPCPGQAANEDDVALTWGGAGPTATSTSTATTTATPTSSGSPTASPTSTSTSTVRPTSTTSPRPTSTATRSTTPGQSARTVTLFTSAAKTSYGSRITLSGQVFSSNASCDDVGESVQLRKRVHGRSSFVDAAAASTDIEGRFSVTVQALQNADYVAVAPAHDQCAEATSPSVTTLVRVKVSAKTSSQRVGQGDRFRISGKVVPKHSGKIKLQRKEGRRWRGAGSVRLTNRGTFVFQVTASWSGRRAFRVVWPSQDEDHEKGTSKKMVVTAT